MILESALLPILEQALATGSLLEMAKDVGLYKSYLELIKVLSEDKNLNFTMVEIGNDYVP